MLCTTLIVSLFLQATQQLVTKTPTLRLPLQHNTAKPHRLAMGRWRVHSNLLQGMEPSLLTQPLGPSCLPLALLPAQCPLLLACPPQLACLLPLGCLHLLACPLLLALACLLQDSLSLLPDLLVAILGPLLLALLALLVVILVPRVAMGLLLEVLVVPQGEEVFVVVVVEEEGE